MAHSGLVPALSKRSLINCITQELEKFSRVFFAFIILKLFTSTLKRCAKHNPSESLK